MRMTEKAYLTWSNFDVAMSLLAETMEQHSEEFDYIVGIARGGLPGAVRLSHVLDTDFAAIEADHYDGTDEEDDVEVGDFTEIPGGDVLIFDDVVDTGDTMRAVESIVDSMIGPGGSVTTASLNIKESASFDPDYWVEKVDDDTWVVYPWEVDNEA